MKMYLKNITKQLKNYSSTLDKTSVLIDKPWALIDNEHEIQKLIFKKDKELILSKNGQVQVGKWEYFPEAKSLLIDRYTDKILCNEAFIDEAVMILRLDGTDSKFFVFANENIIPNLDVYKYLKDLRYQKLKIIETKLIDGRILEVQRDEVWEDDPKIGNSVTEETEPITDGIYQLAKNEQYFEVRKSRISKILTQKKYINPSGQIITIQQQSNWKINFGDYVSMNGKQIENGIIDFSKSKKIIVKDGVVVNFEYKNKILKRCSETWENLWKNNLK